MWGIQKHSSSRKVATSEKKTVNSSREVTSASKAIVIETKRSPAKLNDTKIAGNNTKIIESKGTIIPSYKEVANGKNQGYSRSSITTSSLTKKESRNEKASLKKYVYDSSHNINNRYATSVEKNRLVQVTTASKQISDDHVKNKEKSNEETKHANLEKREKVNESNFEEIESSSHESKHSSTVISQSVTKLEQSAEERQEHVTLNDSITPFDGKRIVTTLYQLEPTGDAPNVNEQSVQSLSSEQRTSFTSLVQNKEYASKSQTYQFSSQRHDDEQKSLSSMDVVDKANFIEDHQYIFSDSSVGKSESYVLSNVSVDTKSASDLDTVIVTSNALNKSVAEKETTVADRKTKTDVDFKQIYKGPIKEQCICEICTCG